MFQWIKNLLNKRHVKQISVVPKKHAAHKRTLIQARRDPRTGRLIDPITGKICRRIKGEMEYQVQAVFCKYGTGTGEQLAAFIEAEFPDYIAPAVSSIYRTKIYKEKIFIKSKYYKGNCKNTCKCKSTN